MPPSIGQVEAKLTKALERIERLESRLADREKTLARLNRLVSEHHAVIEHHLAAGALHRDRDPARAH